MRISMKLSDGDVTSPNGNHRTITLAGEPFCIGRDPGEPGWQLSDPQSMVSRRHCSLSLRDGEILLTDHSTHGTAVGTMHSRLVEEQPTVLDETATIYLAGIARIDIWFGNAMDMPRQDPGDAWPIEEARKPSSMRSRPEESIPGRQVPPSGGIERPPSTPNTSMPPPAPRPPEASPSASSGPGFAPLPPRPPVLGPGTAPPRPGGITPPRITPPGKNEPSDTPPSVEAPDSPSAPSGPERPAPRDTGQGNALSGGDDFYATLCAALGVTPDSLPEDRTLAVQEIGRGYREMADALRVLLMARRDVKIALGLGATVMERGTNPLKSVGGAREAVATLVNAPQAGFADGAAIVNDAAADLQSHQLALVAAIRAAIDVALTAFDPATLEAKIGSGSLLDRVPGRRKAALWDAFDSHYGAFRADAEDDIRRVLGRELDRLYNADPRGEQR